MNVLAVVSLFVIGSCLGSFFNVIGLRVPKAMSFVHGRSQCMSCNKSLYWYELIPIFSYIWLKGRCKICHQKISVMYPLIELLTGLLFVFSYLHLKFTPELITALCFVSLLMIVLVTDFTYMIIPNRILLFFFPIFLLLRLFFPLQSWTNSLLGAVCGIVLIGLVIILSRGAMGAGDMKLLGLIGIVIGWDKTLLTFFIAVCTGACAAYLIFLPKRSMKEPIPFAPYLVIGAIASYFYGDTLIQFYTSFMFPYSY